MPKRVFSGTTIAAIRRVSQSACRKAGRAIASHTDATPPEKVAQSIIATGPATRSPR